MGNYWRCLALFPLLDSTLIFACVGACRLLVPLFLVLLCAFLNYATLIFTTISHDLCRCLSMCTYLACNVNKSATVLVIKTKGKYKISF